MATYAFFTAGVRLLEVDATVGGTSASFFRTDVAEPTVKFFWVSDKPSLEDVTWIVRTF